MPESGEYGGVVPANLGDLHDVARTAPSDGDTLVWNASSGTWEPGQSGTSGSAVYWSGHALGANKVTLAEILAADTIVWTEQLNVGGFALSMDGKTLTLPAGSLFAAVLHISGYDNSDGVMIAQLLGTAIAGGRSASITPLTGDDYGEGESTVLYAGGVTDLSAGAGYGSITPTKGSFEAYLTVYQIV